MSNSDGILEILFRLIRGEYVSDKGYWLRAASQSIAFIWI
jgi:hypothetical protein